MKYGPHDDTDTVGLGNFSANSKPRAHVDVEPLGLDHGRALRACLRDYFGDPVLRLAGPRVPRSAVHRDWSGSAAARRAARSAAASAPVML